jgi:co-chaperonin GroES (HSP10)
MDYDKSKAARIKPSRSMILVGVFDEDEGPSVGGRFYVKKDQDVTTKAGLVLAVGKGVSADLKIGSTIFFKPRSVETVSIGGEIFTLINDEAVVSVLEKEKLIDEKTH